MVINVLSTGLVSKSERKCHEFIFNIVIQMEVKATKSEEKHLEQKENMESAWQIKENEIYRIIYV